MQGHSTLTDVERAERGKIHSRLLKKSIQIALLTILFGLLVWGFINPNGIRAAYANNVWSVDFVNAFFNNPNTLEQIPDPPETHVHGRLFQIQRSLLQKDYDLAMENIQPLVEANDHLAQDAYVTLLYMQEDYTKALEIWEKVGNIRLIERAAQELLNSSKPEIALLGLRTLYRVDPDKYTISLAHTLMTMGELDEALQIFQKSINEFPKSEFKYHWLRYSADIYRERREYDLAEATYMQALEVNPEDPRSWRNLGLMYAGDFKDYATAAGYFEKMVALDPSDPFGFYYLGTIYESAGLVEKAIDAYKAALKIDPDYEDAREALTNLTSAD